MDCFFIFTKYKGDDDLVPIIKLVGYQLSTFRFHLMRADGQRMSLHYLSKNVAESVSSLLTSPSSFLTFFSQKRA